MQSRSRTNKRNTDEVIILCISGAISVCLLPFIVLRFLQEEWAVAILNSTAVIFTSATFFHVLATGQTELAKKSLSILSVVVMTITIYLKGAEQIVWVYPALTIIFYLLSSYKAALISALFMIAVTSMIWSEADAVYLLKFIVSALATLLFCFAFSAKMRSQADFLSNLASTDGLTGAGNRRALDEKLNAEVARLSRYQDLSCSLIMFDIDFFKKINDKYGHSVGDDVLQGFAKLIRLRIRDTDYLYRLGGEEFVVVLENTKMFDAMALALELNADIADSEWPVADLSVTSSAGVAQYLSGETAHQWLARADSALYKAKNSGRNCCLAEQVDIINLIRQARQLLN